MDQQRLENIFSKDFIKGLKHGLQIAKDVAKKQGYEISFPDVDDMLVEKEENKDGKNE